ncbi:glycosyltransferase 87 family protein [Streptomyces hainanensis]|uniref:glycosyltransferase 87 family protein n=1 Tax=Streptomyces hainanensis TaxID=402648 RepID=UPI001404D6B2|nr:glycosyltransferase 87 family protein [Streptomyces hainanensis]
MLPAVGEPLEPRGFGLRSAAPLLAGLTCALSFAACWLAQLALDLPLGDLDVYRAEGWAVRTGGDLYGLTVTAHELPATYPPFAALLFVPLTLLSVDAIRGLVCVLNFALVVALAHLSLRLVGGRLAPWHTGVSLTVASLAVWSEPVWATIRYGQINLLLVVLVLWDLTRRADHRWAGVATGVAAGIKLTPALFAVLLTAAGTVLAVARLRRGEPPGNPHLRWATRSWLAFAGTVGVGVLLLPRESWRFWTDVVLAGDRVGAAEAAANQSLRGVLARVLHTGDLSPWWLSAAAAVCCAGVAVSVAALLAADRLPLATAWAATSCAVTALLVSPVSWSHHWVWAVPVSVLLFAEARRRRDRVWRIAAWTATLLAFSYASWLLPHDESRPELHLSAAQQLVAAAYPLAGTCLLIAAGTLAVRAGRARHRAVPAR